MKTKHIRLNDWESGTIAHLTKIENIDRRKKGQKDLKESEMLHKILEVELPKYLAKADASEGGGADQPTML